MQVVEHRADVARLQIEMEIGGIYLDTDTAVLKNVDELRAHEMVLAEEQKGALGKILLLFGVRNGLRFWEHYSTLFFWPVAIML